MPSSMLEGLIYLPHLSFPSSEELKLHYMLPLTYHFILRKRLRDSEWPCYGYARKKTAFLDSGILEPPPQYIYRIE